MIFEPEVWGPHYWFFLMTVALSYPNNPNSVTKRKYYDLIINFPLFIPDTTIGDKFSNYIDKYPVSPYLDCRDSFLKWVIFIHNKINYNIGKPELSLEDAMEQYYANYNTNKVRVLENHYITKKTGIFIGISITAIIIYFFYK
jgi:hypothetical protein